jgi:hypothetical protein
MSDGLKLEANSASDTEVDFRAFESGRFAVITCIKFHANEEIPDYFPSGVEGEIGPD